MSTIFDTFATLHSQVVCKSGVLPFKCPLCRKEFAAPNTLANHMLVHQDSTAALDCSKCGRKFRKPGSHLKHEAHCQQTPSLPCSRCGAKFPTQEQLRRHSKNHIGEQFQCNICEKTFTHSNGFTQHKKSHIDERYWLLVDISICKLIIFQASMP